MFILIITIHKITNINIVMFKRLSKKVPMCKPAQRKTRATSLIYPRLPRALAFSMCTDFCFYIVSYVNTDQLSNRLELRSFQLNSDMSADGRPLRTGQERSTVTHRTDQITILNKFQRTNYFNSTFFSTYVE